MYWLTCLHSFCQYKNVHLNWSFLVQLLNNYAIYYIRYLLSTLKLNVYVTNTWCLLLVLPSMAYIYIVGTKSVNKMVIVCSVDTVLVALLLRGRIQRLVGHPWSAHYYLPEKYYLLSASFNLWSNLLINYNWWTTDINNFFK